MAVMTHIPSRQSLILFIIMENSFSFSPLIFAKSSNSDHCQSCSVYISDAIRVNPSLVDPSLIFPNETAMVDFIRKTNTEDVFPIWGGIVFQVDTSESGGEEFPIGQITFKVSFWEDMCEDIRHLRHYFKQEIKILRPCIYFSRLDSARS